MKWIVNCLLDVIIFLWSMWVCAWRRASLDAPFRKWFIKCKNAKKKSGRIIWKEFFAIMKYLTLHYVQRHGEAEKYYEYESYVDMTPFTYENRGRYTEDDWDMLVGMQYGLYEQPQTNLPNNKKSNVQEQIDVKKELSSRQMEEPVHAEQVINNQIENAIPVQPEESLQQEQPTYIEEEENSKTWLYVLLAVLIGGAGWYFFVYDSGKATSEDTDQTTPIEQTNNVPVENEEEVEASTPLAFLEQFYKGNLNDADYIKQHVTANMLNKLKRDYGNDCPSGNCIATWVFTAYPPGSDLFLEQGPIITKDKEAGKYSVVYRYYSQVQGGRIYKPRGLLLSVTEIDGKYLISDYELAMPDIVQNQDDLSNNSDEQVTHEVQETQARETPPENNDSKDMSTIAFKPQETKAHESPKVEDTNIYDKVDQMPSFPGGQRALMSRINSNLKYPVAAEENGIQGKVLCSFVVERDGSISDVRVVRGVDPSLDREAVRVLKQMPHWIPGKKNGSVVRVRINVPVTFSLQ